MKRSLLVLTLITAAALMSACEKKDAAAPAAVPKGPPVATVDGRPVSAELFDFYAKNRAGKPVAELTDEQKQSFLDELIQIQLTAQAAEKGGLDNKDPDVVGNLEYERLNVLANAAVQSRVGKKDPTEQELRAEYETQLASQPRLEYRARHILVATEGFAQSLIEQLNKGASFADLAKKHSMDGSKEQGGDLNWFKPGQMVKPFNDALVALKKGEITQKPVQTQFGWHVIKLEDTRETTPPDFEQVRQGLVQLVKRKKVQAYIEELKKTARIEKKLPGAKPEETKPEARTEEAPKS